MTHEDLDNRFTYHAPDAAKGGSHQRIRGTGLALADLINIEVPDCREKSLAVTKLEEAVMWANAGLSRN